MIRLPDKLLNNKYKGTRFFDCPYCDEIIRGDNDVNVEIRANLHVKKKHYEIYVEAKKQGLIGRLHKSRVG